MNRIMVESTVALTPMRGKASSAFADPVAPSVDRIRQDRRLVAGQQGDRAASPCSRGVAQPQTDAHATLVG